MYRRAIRMLLGAALFLGIFGTSGCAFLSRATSSSPATAEDSATSSSLVTGESKVVPRPRLSVGELKAPEASGIDSGAGGNAGSAAYKFKAGDPVVIFLRGIMPKDEQYEDIIDEAGNVNLPYIDSVRAAGKTTSQLEKEIQKSYLDQRIYKSVTVNVVMPSQSYFVRGEVRNPGRFSLITGVTLVQAIASAGGYTDYADPTKVKIVRGEKTNQHNARDYERFPERDISVEPGDVIVVPRSIF